jgi:hypothetical protein
MASTSSRVTMLDAGASRSRFASLSSFNPIVMVVIQNQNPNRRDGRNGVRKKGDVFQIGSVGNRNDEGRKKEEAARISNTQRRAT